MSIQITLNGDPLMLEKNINISELVTKLRLSGRLAIELNHSIIPRSAFATYDIQPGDKIEIVEAIGGG